MAIQDVLPPLIDDRDGIDGAAHDRVHRFGSSERFLHWWIVVMFASALLTGVAMGDEAESGSLLKVHIGSVVLIGVGIAIALIFGNTMAILRSAKDLFFFDRIDLAFVVNTVRHPGHPGHVRWGKFNVGQKILAWSLVGSLAAVVVTGMNSWSAGEGAAGPHAAAVVVTLALLSAHVFMAVINPSTRPALPGMVFGHVRRSWAAKHHSAWLEDADRRHFDKAVTAHVGSGRKSGPASERDLSNG